LIATAPGALLWPAATIVWGPGYASAEHRHHCAQLVMAMAKTLRIRGASHERWMRCGAALVRPDAIHEVDASETPVLIAFIDAESELGAALIEQSDQDIRCIPSTEVARWRRTLGQPAALDAAQVERWLMSDLLQRRRPASIHPSVRRVLRYLRDNLAHVDDLSLPNLASVARLSPSRFMHVFTQSVGVPLRPYVLWLRLQRASAALMEGASVTDAAHVAGFADAAHLTRTFRRMLGTTPRELARRRTVSGAVLVESD